MPSGTAEENAEYMRDYRESNGDYEERNRNRVTALRNARKALAERRPKEYQRIRANLKVPPRDMTNVARKILGERYPRELEHFKQRELSSMRLRGMRV